MSTPLGLVSVGVCVYNGEKYLSEALDSIWKQTYPELEALVFDDGSTDSTPDILAAIDDVRLRVISNRSNLGLGFGRQRLKEEAAGSFLTWLDADDRFHPDRIKRLLSLSRETDCQIACDAYRLIDKDGRPTGSFRIPQKISKEPHFTRLFERNAMIPHPLIRRDCFSSIDYDVGLRSSNDYDFWLQCSLRGIQFRVTSEVGVDYRLCSDSLSKDHENSRRETQQILMKYSAEVVDSLYRTRGFSEPQRHYMRCLFHLFRLEYRDAFDFAKRPWPIEPEVDQDFYRGTLALRTGDLKNGHRYLSQHLSNYPESAAGQNNFGVLSERLGEDPVPYFSRALELMADYADSAHNLLGRPPLKITDTLLSLRKSRSSDQHLGKGFE